MLILSYHYIAGLIIKANGKFATDTHGISLVSKGLQCYELTQSQIIGMSFARPTDIKLADSLLGAKIPIQP